MRGYRAEAFLLALVAVLGLSLLFGVTEQDRTRLALSQAIVDHGTLRIDAYQRQFGDKAAYGRHFYTDKAPGLSFLAVPTYALLRGLGLVPRRERRDGVWHSAALLWVLRLMTGGIFFVLEARETHDARQVDDFRVASKQRRQPLLRVVEVLLCQFALFV